MCANSWSKTVFERNPMNPAGNVRVQRHRRTANRFCYKISNALDRKADCGLASEVIQRERGSSRRR